MGYKAIVYKRRWFDSCSKLVREKIQCKIDYKDSKPSFVIYFEKNENQISVSSNKSASGVTEKYLKVVITIHY